MACHATKSGFGQCECHWCGRRGVTRFGPRECAVNDDIRRALKAFAEKNGRTWKSKLCDHWEKACSDISDMDERCLLQQARNIIGPRGLAKITPSMLSRVA